MASSGTYAFTTTRDEIIRQAALMLGAVAASGSLPAQLMQDFAHQLNGMVKRWEASGIHLWKLSEGVLFPVPGQVKYQLGDSSTDRIADNPNETTISVAEAAGQTTLSVTSTAAMTVGDEIGIHLSDLTLHWSTISSKTSTTVTIASALTSSASIGAKVYSYPAKIQKALRISDYRRHDILSAIDVPVERIDRAYYFSIANKLTAGSMLQAYYQPNRNSGNLYIYQVPPYVTELLKFTYYKRVEIFTAAGDNPDLPDEWVQALEFNLAMAMMPQYPARDAKQRREIIDQARLYKAELEGCDRETEGIQFVPDMG